MLNQFILFRAAMTRPGDLFQTTGKPALAASSLALRGGIPVLALVLGGYAALTLAVLLSS